MSEHETLVVENARLELLRGMVIVDDMFRRMVADGTLEKYHGWQMLFTGDGDDFENDPEMIEIAAKECSALGLIERHVDPHDGEVSVKLLDAGRDWIRAHDALGEVLQESRSTPGEHPNGT